MGSLSMTDKKTQMDLTEGPILSKLILFALPFLGSSLIQELYSMVDVMFIGNFLGTDASAAASAGTNITSFLLKIFSGFGIGVGIAVARAYGAKNESWISEIIHTVATVTVTVSLILTAAAMVFARQFLIWLSTPEDILDMATTYIRIYFVSEIAAICYNMSNGILSALGDSSSALLYQFIGGLVNVAGDAVLTLVFGCGINGIAAASVLAQTVAALFTVLRLAKLPEAYRFSLKKLHVNGNALKEVLRLGIPSALQMGIINFSNMTVQSQINSLGTVSIAAFGAYYQAENFIYYPIAAVGSAYVTFVGQNSGAGRDDRLKKGLRIALAMSLLMAVTTISAEIPLRRTVFSLFTSDADVLELGCRMGMRSFLFYWVFCPYDVLGADLRGRGITLPTMLMSLLCLSGIRLVILFYIMGRWPDAVSAVTVYPITWAIGSLALTAERAVCIRLGKYHTAGKKTA